MAFLLKERRRKYSQKLMAHENGKLDIDINEIDELMNSISTDIKQLETIVNNFGITKDTQKQKKEFNAIRLRVTSTMNKVPRMLSGSFTRKAIKVSNSDTHENNVSFSDFDTTKYSEQLSTYSRKYKDIMHRYREQSKSIFIEESYDEQKALLSDTQQIPQYVDIDDIGTVKVVDERKLLEDEEKYMQEIQEKIKYTRDSMEQLGGIIDEQDILVTGLEDVIGNIAVDIGEGEKELEGAERRKKKSRNNKLVLLLLLIIVLAIIVVLIWAYNKT